jgi:hypothetical protein
MDQNSTNGTDKRNWRERLGIGTKDMGTKDMPRIADDFKPEQAASKAMATAPAVKPAPMAPRAAPKAVAPIAPRPAPRPAGVAPVDSDALANKLRSQREAAEKLAEQRVQAARQRAESINVTATPTNGAAKPKFTFAEDEPKSAIPQRPAAAMPSQARPAALQPQPQMTPARAPLGGNALPSRPPQQQQYQPRQPLPPPPQNYPAGYNPNPGYRPIDPATGYAPQPQYNPNQGFAPQPRQGGFTPQSPRLQVPPRQQQSGDVGYGYEGQRAGPRLNPPQARVPVAPSFGEVEQDDIFEQPAPRMQKRATANDYQQAYREAETGYEDDNQKSRGPWILLSLLALALIVGFGSVWAYNNYVKPKSTIAAVDTVPVVKAPDTPVKVTGDNAVVPDAAAGGNNTVAPAPSKKQIYDRIVGDREVLGGQLAPTEEVPVQPANNSQPVPAPAAGTGDDGTPLPLPPPPGDTGQQGSLEPAPKGDQQDAVITPAAGASQAAASPSVEPAPQIPDPPAPEIAAAPAVEPPAAAPAPEQQVASVAAASEDIAPAAATEITTPKKIAVPKPVVAKKIVAAKPIKSLGASPVVLVPPSRQVAVAKPIVKSIKTQNAEGGLYGDGASAPLVVDAPVATPVKRKSLFDLFKSDTAKPDQVAALTAPAVTAPKIVAPDVPAPAPAPVSVSNAYVAQLASFKSKAEATQEYKSLSAKHGPIISRYAPIITEAQVAGTTRYRLSIGPMATSNVASGVCQSLFAAGERDCLVHRQ